MTATKALLKMCSPFYHNLKLTPDCQENDYWFCQQVPKQCSLHNAVYNILYYLVDINFLPPNVSILKLVKVTFGPAPVIHLNQCQSSS